MENHGFLGNQGDVLAERGERQRSDVDDAVQPDLATIRIVESQQQLGDGGFPGPARPGDHHQFPWVGHESKAVSGRLLGAWIVEGHVGDLDDPASPRRRAIASGASTTAGSIASKSVSRAEPAVASLMARFSWPSC